LLAEIYSHTALSFQVPESMSAWRDVVAAHLHVMQLYFFNNNNDSLFCCKEHRVYFMVMFCVTILINVVNFVSGYFVELLCGWSLYINYVVASAFYSGWGLCCWVFMLQYEGRLFSIILNLCGAWGVTTHHYECMTTRVS
jgi:hypothetical protein